VGEPSSDDQQDSDKPSLELTLGDELGQVPVRVAAIDAEHLRNSIAARMFGSAADPVKIDRYTVLKRLGAGGMGVVYAAYDTELDRKVAIKLLRGVDDEGAHRTRLKREAQALAKFSHPNVVQVFDVGDFRQQVFVAMEFVEGVTLREWQPKKEGNRVQQIIERFIEAGRGLAVAHAAGLVHRDFKPDNVLVGNDGRVRVLDFGLARGVDQVGQESESTLDQNSGLLDSSDSSLHQPLTRTGAILGTPAYMSPEQHLGRRADARSDQFAFCVALWEKLYGERPFRARDIRQLALRVIEGRIEEPESPGQVPHWLRRVLERGMAIDPAHRWPDMNALLDALSSDPRKRNGVLALAGVIGVLAMAGVVYMVMREPEPSPCEGGERELVGVWDDDVRERVHTAFLGTKAPYAQAAWEGTTRHLDEYAREWVGMHREVCEASVVRQEDDAGLFGRKMVCLGQRKTELEQLTSLLGEADADMVSLAVVAASSLTRIESCADERSLIEDVDDERLGELERLLASANGRKAFGKYDEGFDIALQALELAKQIGTPHGEGRVQLLLGDLQTKRGKVPEAEHHLRESLRRADQAGDDATRVQALIQLMRVSYLQHELDEGEALAADARAALDRLGGAPLIEADFCQHFASLALARGDSKTASEYNLRALEIREKQLGADHPEVAISLTNIANVYTASGQHDEAEKMARRALAIFEARLGVDHPYTAASHNNIGNSLLEQGRHIGWDDPAAAKPYLAEAERHYRAAVDIRAAQLGADHPKVALNLHNLGEAQRLQGAYDDARKTFERSLEIKLEHMQNNPSVAITQTGLGRVLLELGEAETARKLLEDAVELRKQQDSSPDARAETAFALARALLATAPEAQALTLAREWAETAQAAYLEAGEDYRGERQEVERWLAAHPAKP
jgi:tetratricopeptide (TPR) repeat protein/predicted Ser/Thr protein kinase